MSKKEPIITDEMAERILAKAPKLFGAKDLLRWAMEIAIRVNHLKTAGRLKARVR